MKRKVMIASVAALLLVCGVTFSGLYAESENVKTSLSYGTYVDGYIQQCEGKTEMLNSGSLNIRKSAMQTKLKGDFIKSNRTALIDYLMEKDVPLNAARIEYHLTTKFTETLHPEGVYTVMLEKRVDQ